MELKSTNLTLEIHYNPETHTDEQVVREILTILSGHGGTFTDNSPRKVQVNYLPLNDTKQ